MALTRRRFLSRAGLATAASFAGPGFWRNPLLRSALADAIGDRYFVVILLGGGNDGLNTVVPYDDGTIGAFRTHYESYRNTGSGGLRIPQSALVDTVIGTDPSTATPLALHPSLTGFKSVYDLGKVAIVQGCGYPRPSLSHAESTQRWATGDPLGTGLGGGWMGRYLATQYGVGSIPAVSTQDVVPDEFAQTATGVLAVEHLQSFTLPHDAYDPSDNTAKDAAYAAMFSLAQQSSQPTMRYAGNVGNSVLAATASYPGLHDVYVADRPAWNGLYENVGPTTEGLREVAKTIYGVVQGSVQSRFCEILAPNYDTHADQGAAEPSSRHSTLLSDLGTGLTTFYNDCADMGIADKLCIFVWSEFGRRLKQNENGSDHGTQGPVLVIGGGVNGGIYGNHPDIQPGSIDPEVPNTVYSQAAGDPHRSTDFRDVYGTLLKHWLGLSDTETQAILPIDSGNPALYWTAPNFDLPFLD